MPVPRAVCRASLVGILWLLSACTWNASYVVAQTQVSSRTQIVVDCGPFGSAAEAAASESRVNWLDGATTDDRICTECFAAVELQRYLRRMTGREEDFAIADDQTADEGAEWLLVGGPASNAASRRVAGILGVDEEKLLRLGPQGYVITSGRVSGRRVTMIAGGGRVGTLYGVYNLLHRLGCRWFAPGPLHEEIPHIESLPELDVQESPDFLTRGFHAWENRADRQFLLWMARNRLNYWCVEQEDRPLMRKLGIQLACGRHTAQSLFLNPEAAYPYDHPKFQGDEGKPADPYPLSDEYQGDANGDGRLSYFEAHPEWYALVDGRRVPGIRDGFGTNYCTSNPHATAEFMKNYVEALADGVYREADVVRFWTLDGGRWCQCAPCRALGTPTDRNLLLVRRLDEEIKRARAAGRIQRPIVIRFLAYADVLQPPSRPLPPGFDYQTCSATFFPIVRCYVHHFADPHCRKNSYYRRQLDGWATDPKRHYRGALCIGEYYNVSGYRSLPVCFMHTMARDIPYYYSVGARHFHYMHVTTANWGNKALTNYQMARQLWDVDVDCEALWADYFARRYGPAAVTMRRFYESLEKMLCNVSELKYGLARRLDRGAEELFPDPHLRFRREPGLRCDGPTLMEIVEYADRCRRLLNEALAGRLPERVRARIEEDERMFVYGQRTVQYYAACAKAFLSARAGQIEEARRSYQEARRLAELLREDTESVAHCYSGGPANALEASNASHALDHLARLLGRQAEQLK